MEKFVIKSSKGNPVTTSLIVAEVFEKNHKDVLESISNLVAENSAAKYFYKSYFNNRGKQYPMYVMNRDGFSLLVMGFTGEKALKFKIAFIEAFNAMENQLKYFTLPDFNDPVISARAWADEREKNVIADSRIRQLEPKAEFADKVIGSENMVDIGQAAKLLKLPFGRNIFFKNLRGDKILFKNRNEPMQEYIERGYFDLREITIDTNEHGSFSIKKVYVTQKGLFWLSKKYNGCFKPGLPELNVL